jgi:hypothetical protein
VCHPKLVMEVPDPVIFEAGMTRSGGWRRPSVGASGRPTQFQRGGDGGHRWGGGGDPSPEGLDPVTAITNRPDGERVGAGAIKRPWGEDSSSSTGVDGLAASTGVGATDGDSARERGSGYGWAGDAEVGGEPSLRTV